MRLFKAAAAAWILPSLALAFILPSSLSSTSLVLQADVDDGQFIRFSVPCPDCSPARDSQLTFELKTRPGDGTCESNALSINGDVLDQSWDGLEAWGEGKLRALESEALTVHDVAAVWQSLCIPGSPENVDTSKESTGSTSVLSVTIDPRRDHAFHRRVGFTVSFTLGKEPTFIRMTDEAIELSHDEKTVEAWINPSPDHRLKLSPASSPKSSLSPMEEEILELHYLEVDMKDLQHLVEEKKHQVRKLMKQDLKSFGSKMKQCDSLSCIWKGIMRKLPEVAGSVASYLQRPMRTPPKSDYPHSMHPDGLQRHHRHYPFPPIPEDSFEETHGRPHSPSIGKLVAEATLKSVHDGIITPHQDAPLPPHHDGPPEHHDRHHPQSHRIHPPHHHHLHKTILPFLVVILTCSLVFVILRKRLLSPQRRADRAFRKEERRSRRAYRRAACRHRVSQWWSTHRRPTSSKDYEEKRAHIVDQEDVLEDAMQKELRDLQRAHELVGEMVCAQNGRERLYRLANSPPHAGGMSPAELEAGVGIGFPSSSTASGDPDPIEAELPPPRYSEDLQGEITVVDGFMYTPSGTDETPDSSIVDCSPRLSLDTSRTRASSNATRE